LLAPFLIGFVWTADEATRRETEDGDGAEAAGGCWWTMHDGRRRRVQLRRLRLREWAAAADGWMRRHEWTRGAAEAFDTVTAESGRVAQKIQRDATRMHII
jgi:hypothetical protein